MTKILHATSRGQITLPKSWRDKTGTKYFQVTVHDDKLIVRPIHPQKTLQQKVEDSWSEYEKGEIIDHHELTKKYGL